MTWYPPDQIPSGTPHGSAGVCLTTSGEIVLVKIRDVDYWELPAGRPEGNENWEQTLRREVAEEGCATVLDADLIGFCRTCNETDGTVRVRSYWKTTVQVNDWKPLHEIESRMVIAPRLALPYLSLVHKPITIRAMVEAGALDKRNVDERGRSASACKNHLDGRQQCGLCG